ncbi:unnamed protein product [Sphenostylis stenocarpa]|uniref:Uncharacterized protein n=1 Tax=Sphenostylis stenocarpa TaxID=92480 RepID=A0AA86SWZ0_9FABA|nr:unnamed protein product [Sphenostylis stenocarpa]
MNVIELEVIHYGLEQTLISACYIALNTYSHAKLFETRTRHYKADKMTAFVTRNFYDGRIEKATKRE